MKTSLAEVIILRNIYIAWSLLFFVFFSMNDPLKFNYCASDTWRVVYNVQLYVSFVYLCSDCECIVHQCTLLVVLTVKCWKLWVT